MFPAERGEMGEEAVWNLFDLAQGGCQEPFWRDNSVLVKSIS
jgi:hypothetical protein